MRFASLVLLLAKRCITMHWRSPEGPPLAAWVGAVKKWGKAEEEILRTEEARGIRKNPISMPWAMLLHSYTQELHTVATAWAAVSPRAPAAEAVAPADA